MKGLSIIEEILEILSYKFDSMICLFGAIHDALSRFVPWYRFA